MRARYLAAVVFGLLGGWTWADYPDTPTLLKRLAEPLPQQEAKVEEKAESPQAALIRDLKEFVAKAASIPAEEAAGEWLKLFDRQGAFQVKTYEPFADGRLINAHRFGGGGDEDEDYVGVRGVLLALPPPSHWAALAQAIERRPALGEKASAREIGLRLLGAILIDDRQARKDLVERLKKLDSSLLDALIVNAQGSRGDQNSLAVLAGEAVGRPTGEEVELDAQGADVGTEREVPDLVALVGREKAEARLTELLTKQRGMLAPPAGSETAALAREIALRRVDDLQSPQWLLVASPKEVALYEALAKRFPVAEGKISGALGRIFGGRRKSGEDSEVMRARSSATLKYLAGLIVANRMDDAGQILGKFDDVPPQYAFDELFDSLRGEAAIGVAAELFQEQIEKKANSPFWSSYVKLASTAGQAEPAIERLQSALAGNDLTSEQRAHLNELLITTLLATDKVDAAIEAIQNRIKVQEPIGYTLEDAIKLANLGNLLGRPELQSEGLKAARAAVERQNPEGEQWGFVYDVPNLVREMAASDQGKERVDVLVLALRRVVHREKDEFAGNSEIALSASSLMAELVSLYASAGKYPQVVQMLDEAPYWSAGDLADMLHDIDPRNRRFAEHAAESLAAVGRKDEALRILDALLDRYPGEDSVYAVWIKVLNNSEQAIRRLDGLFARDQFEERPLIWKAELQRRGGQLDEAEATVRRAISIDPSDGEQPAGDRMRAYAVLAEILTAKGNAKDAALYRNVVKAIRMSEDADKLSAAGLKQRAIELYKQSAEVFRDAYCVQSRLAIELADAGDFEAAAAAYRRAYELMPDSFGRMESHCFGCEGAFRGEAAQKIAEQVFTELAREQPTKPQVHYLLAYLRMQQGRYADAVAPLRRAVQLDPDYVNAWKTFQELSDKTEIPQSELEAAALNLVRLDPLQRHVAAEFEHVDNARALWLAVAEAEKQKPAELKSLFPLRAAKARLSTEKASPDVRRYRIDDMRTTSPAKATLSSRPFQILTSILDD